MSPSPPLDTLIKIESKEVNLVVVFELSSDGSLDSVRFDTEKAFDDSEGVITKGYSDCPVCNTTLTINLKVSDGRLQDHNNETVFSTLLEPLPLLNGLKDENEDLEYPKVEEPVNFPTELETENNDKPLLQSDVSEESDRDFYPESSGSERNSSLGPTNRCNLCTKTFKRKADLKQHREDHNLICELCDKPQIFINQNSLSKHVRRHHSTPSSQPPPKVKKQSHQKGTRPTGAAFNLITCPVCLEVFKQKQDLKEHYIGHTTTCKFCNPTRVYPSVLHLKWHCLKTHRNLMPATAEVEKCAGCKIKFTKIGWERHIQVCEILKSSGHSSQPPPQHVKSYHCSLCFQIFFSFQELTAHNKDHSLTCKFCPEPKTFNAAASLHTHVSVHHAHLRPITDSAIKCPICGRHFDEKVFRRHKEFCDRLLAASKPKADSQEVSNESTAAPVKLKPKCPICDKELTRLKHLKKHIDVVHKNLRNHTCNYCGKSFAQKVPFLEHLKLHENPDPLICHFCAKKFPLKRQMLKHIKAMHIISDLPRHPCDECPKTFKRYADMLKHKRYHNGDLPFRCQYCQKGYNDRSLMQRHEMMHRDERPFSCTYCDQRFRQKAGLVSHLRLHTGEKPYECSICKQRFHDRGCYRSHLLKHEKELGITLDKSVKRFIVIQPDI